MCGTGDEVPEDPDRDEKPPDMEATLVDRTVDEPLPSDDEGAGEDPGEEVQDLSAQDVILDSTSSDPGMDSIELEGSRSPQPKETLVPLEEEDGEPDEEEEFFDESPGYLPLDESVEQPEEAPEAKPEGILLKQDGKVYHVRNLATIQRWIVERRVIREDLVSSGGLNWEPVGQHPNLGVFFQMVERLDDLEQRSPGHRVRPLIEDARPEESEELEVDEQPESPGLLSQEEEAEAPDRLTEVSMDEDEFDPEPSDVGVSLDYVKELDDEAWRDAPSRDIRGDKPVTLHVSNDLAQHPSLSPLEEVMATEEISVEVPAPDPVAPEPEDMGGADFDEDFRKHFDADGSELAWVEDRSSRRLQLAALGLAVLLALGAGGKWWFAQQSGDGEEPAPVEQPKDEPKDEATKTEPGEESEEPGKETEPAQETKDDEPEEPQIETPPSAEVEPVPSPDPPKPKPKPKPTGAAALTKQGWTALGQGDVRKARGYFVDAVAAQPTLADAHYGLGYTAATQGDRPTAIRHYCKALEFGRGNQEIERDVPPLLKQVDGSCQ